MASLLLSLPEDLQCPICYETAVPPIKTCKHGHIVCGICAEKVKHCATCRAKLLPMVYMDRMLREKNIHLPCRYLTDGCSESIKAIDMKDHVADCRYQPVTCCLSGIDNCEGTEINFKNALSHFETFHQICVTSYDDNALNINIPYCFLTTPRTRKIDISVLKFDEKDFFIFKVSRVEEHQLLVGLLESQQVSDKYYCMTKATYLTQGQRKEALDEIQMIARTWKVKVFPMKTEKLLSTKSDNEIARTDSISLHQFFQENPFFKSSMEFEWKVNLEICKCN